MKDEPRVRIRSCFPQGRSFLPRADLGNLYRITTNPAEANGDGMAMAARAGAIISRIRNSSSSTPRRWMLARIRLHWQLKRLRGHGAHFDQLGWRTLHGWRAQGPGRARSARYCRTSHPPPELQRARERSSIAGRQSALASPKIFPTVYGHARDAGIDPVNRTLAHFDSGCPLSYGGRADRCAWSHVA